jgi:hypothetical protein
MPERGRLGLTCRLSGYLARAAFIAALAFLPVAFPAPGYAGSPGELPALASNDLGTVRADGTTLRDTLSGFEQANAYTFRVADGPGTAEVYVGDLWYDVDVMLWRASSLPGNPSQWRAMPCDEGAGCLASAPVSARRRVQFVQPKGLFQAVDSGSYVVIVRPRDEAEFSASRQFTLWVAVAPPVCTVASDGEGRYQIALAMTPAHPRRAELVTMTAYVLPPFGDLFDFEWTANGRRLAPSGPTTQAIAFDLAQGRSSGHEVGVVARGARPYPDPEQAEIPPTISATCPLALN